MVLREMLVSILAGIAAGVKRAACCADGYLESQLFGVKAADPLILAIAASGPCWPAHLWGPRWIPRVARLAKSIRFARAGDGSSETATLLEIFQSARRAIPLT